jgi:hypothetical protein
MSDDVAGETWHAPALLGDVVCDCRDGRHDPHNYIISTDSNNVVRDAILRLRDEAREAARLRTEIEGHLKVCQMQNKASDLAREVQRLRAALEQANEMLRWAEFTDEQLDAVQDWRAALEASKETPND